MCVPPASVGVDESSKFKEYVSASSMTTTASGLQVGRGLEAHRYSSPERMASSTQLRYSAAMQVAHGR